MSSLFCETKRKSKFEQAHAAYAVVSQHRPYALTQYIFSLCSSRYRLPVPVCHRTMAGGGRGREQKKTTRAFTKGNKDIYEKFGCFTEIISQLLKILYETILIISLSLFKSNYFLPCPVTIFLLRCKKTRYSEDHRRLSECFQGRRRLSAPVFQG